MSKFYTLIFHEENNKVLIMIDSFMRKIAYNEFINFYKILIINKLRDIDFHKRIYKTDTYKRKPFSHYLSIRITNDSIEKGFYLTVKA